MNIIHIIPTLGKGGAERLAQDICEEIYKRTAYKIKLITFSQEFENNNSLPFHIHIDSFFNPGITSKSILSIEKLQKFIDDFSADIIHSHLWMSEMLLTKINIKEARRFSHFHDNIPQLSTKLLSIHKQGLINSYEKRLFLKNNENQFICISKDTMKYAKEVLPKKYISKIHLIPNGIKFNKFCSDKERELDAINLINIGSFVPKKNQKFAIKILEVLIKRGYRAKIIFLGDGPELENLKKISKDLNLLKHVDFKGNVDDIRPYLSTSNILLHTANYEPFGLVLLEAMASGIPVITLDGKGNRDFINKKNGILISEEDTEIFSDRIIEVFENKEKYQMLSKNGIDTASKYDIKKYVDKLLKLYFSATK